MWMFMLDFIYMGFTELWREEREVSETFQMENMFPVGLDPETVHSDKKANPELKLLGHTS